jgi:hypothetical protein
MSTMMAMMPIPVGGTSGNLWPNPNDGHCHRGEKASIRYNGGLSATRCHTMSAARQRCLALELAHLRKENNNNQLSYNPSITGAAQGA